MIFQDVISSDHKLFIYGRLSNKVRLHPSYLVLSVYLLSLLSLLFFPLCFFIAVSFLLPQVWSLDKVD
jgi:hypothetical protein